MPDQMLSISDLLVGEMPPVIVPAPLPSIPSIHASDSHVRDTEMAPVRLSGVSELGCERLPRLPELDQSLRILELDAHDRPDKISDTARSRLPSISELGLDYLFNRRELPQLLVAPAPQSPHTWSEPTRMNRTHSPCICEGLQLPRLPELDRRDCEIDISQKAIESIEGPNISARNPTSTTRRSAGHNTASIELPSISELAFKRLPLPFETALLARIPELEVHSSPTSIKASIKRQELAPLPPTGTSRTRLRRRTRDVPLTSVSRSRPPTSFRPIDW